MSDHIDSSDFESDGPVQNVWLIDALQTCCFNKKTGKLSVSCDGREGFIYIHSGVVVHTQTATSDGEGAFREMLSWNAASCSLEEHVTSDECSMSMGWEELLREWTQAIEGEKGLDLRMDAEAGFLGGKMIGPYLIRHPLSEDEWGTIYEALQVAVNRTVAIKILRPSHYNDPRMVQHFQAFASAMARINSPYITAVYETGEANHLLYYAGEFFHGINMRDLIDEHCTISQDLSIQLIINIGSALRYENRSGIAHSPLMPDQILIPERSSPKLLNNAAVPGMSVSPDERDEIRRLGNILKDSLDFSVPLLPEFDALVGQMITSGMGGYTSWDQLLNAAMQIDLSVHAQRVIRPITAPQMKRIAPVEKSRWPLILGILLSVILLGGLAYGIWYFLIDTSRGVKNVNVMVMIPEGPFIYQGENQEILPTFYIDKYEVTIGQYEAFLEYAKRNPSSLKEHPNAPSPKDHTPAEWYQMQSAIKNKIPYSGGLIRENTPIFNVDYYDAWAYAAWRGKRLPTEMEWEKAARGPNGNIYPWGNTFDATKANTATDLKENPTDPAFGKVDGFGVWGPVGAKPGDQSYYGVMDMAGNLSEWTASWDRNTRFIRDRAPVIRGGSWASHDVRLMLRNRMEFPVKRSNQIGFRCASDKPPS